MVIKESQDSGDDDWNAFAIRTSSCLQVYAECLLYTMVSG
jgi:hypothetical protein